MSLDIRPVDVDFDIVEPPLVLVTVGSDHHPFDRLVSWVDEWFSRQAEGSVRCIIQYGTSTPPSFAEGHAFLDHDALQDLMASAEVIVTQGGPMSIVEARRAGTVPIVMPRDPQLGEHVDGHQQIFARHMADSGQAFMPIGSQELALLLDNAIDEPAMFVTALDPEARDRVRVTTEKIGAIVDRLVPEHRTDRPRVLLIVGVGRSGSTLFERALGDVAGVEPLGETIHLWERGVRDDELCGCGEPFSECAFWQSVGKRAFDGWDSVDIDDVIAVRHAVIRTRFMPELLGPSLRTTWRLKRDRFARVLSAFYQSVSEESGATLLVDSSKMPAYAALLTRADIDLRCVQVVRDPRGVAYSWSKTVTRPEVTDGSAEMHRYSPAESALWSTVFDVMLRGLSRRGVPVTSVRYEDFVANPRGTVDQVLAFAGHTPLDEDLDHLRPDEVQLQRRHLVAGNPMRFASGSIALKADEQWRAGLRPRDRRLVSALTVRLRRRYGY